MAKKQLPRRIDPARAAARAGFAVLFAVLAAGCGANSAKKSYVLAEKLWTDGNYVAAVSEFEKVIAKDPSGKLGTLALQRAATTQALFLQQYGEAVKKFRRFAEVSAAQDPAAAWDARKQVGEILFTKTEQYEQAVAYYQQLLALRPDAPEAPEFSYRIAKSQFFLWRFDDAIRSFTELSKRYPGTPWAEKALYEVGVTWFTRGEQSSGGKNQNASYQSAISAYQKFIQAFPKSEWVPQARFGIASCLEEMDRLDEATQAYQELLGSYPSPKVIQIKLYRIRERKAQRNH